MTKRRSLYRALVIFACAVPFPPALLLAGTAGEPAQGVDATARAAVQKAQDAQARQRAYRVDETSRGRESTSSKLVYVAPDQYHHRETTSPTRNDEIIMIGRDGWLKSRGRAWEPAPLDLTITLRALRSPPSIDAAGYRVTVTRALPPSELNGATTATYEYAVERDKETWRITMWVTTPGNLPVKYRAEADHDGRKSVQTWEIVYDDSLTVESPAAQVACRTGEQCLDFGMRVRSSGNLSRAAEFYNQACKAESWQGCLGYASHLVGLAYRDDASAPERAKLFDEAVQLLDRVIKAQPKSSRAYFYKGLALSKQAGNPERVKEGVALLAQARSLRAQATDVDAEWDAVLWPPPQ